jgi:hypothetical protein
MRILPSSVSILILAFVKSGVDTSSWRCMAVEFTL